MTERNRQLNLTKRAHNKVRLKQINAKVRHHAKDIPLLIIQDELQVNNGDLKKTSDALHVTLPSLNQLIDRNKALSDVLLAQRSSLVDLAEANLRTELESRSWKATQFTLETLGRNRGYVKKEEHAPVRLSATTVNTGIDLAKLSSEQLKNLSDIMQEQKEDKPHLIDITAETVIS
tara:strand:+ start:87 stop:614 length:528 start_codon:yes stop_codon:yes gene_type:complete